MTMITTLKDLSESRVHRAWMNGRKFTKNGVSYTIVDGIEQFVDGRLRNCIRFTSDGKKLISYTEEEFFDKVELMKQF